MKFYSESKEDVLKELSVNRDRGLSSDDVKSRREQWRIILQPLDENKNPFNPCYIDQISSYVRIVEITEVSKHYE